MSSTTHSVSSFSQALLWFGAAVSLAEIITGALIAPLGLQQGIIAILTGHLIGAFILYLAGKIGANHRLSAAQTVSLSFGQYGSYAFSVLNILQLLGWTAVMIISGAKAFDVISITLWQYSDESLWSLLIGALIILWVLLGIKNLTRVNIIIVSALFLAFCVLAYTVFNQPSHIIFINGNMSFGSTVELNIAMSLSWMPLIADYTRRLKNIQTGLFASVISYFIGSSFMFIVGLGAAIYVGSSDITQILLTAGLGIVALFIVVFSTVTTTFLDVYSAGINLANLGHKISEKMAAILATITGTLMALFISMSQYESFLYLIGSVFAPLFAILFTDYYLLKKGSISSDRLFNLKNTLLWIFGFIVYHTLMSYHSVIGITVPVIILISGMTYLISKLTLSLTLLVKHK
ncbi:putative hydroxymethylpyrimidine transporter CytX [Zophobihabitans entericus]|uniref:Putative hydroxymethylpyrimidine transporter CytX n=1 Tax=Zophobihabitans entericus TaxID=1635327 RepID=A0A6G9IE76_9GAMM|nr:putative hydroxymethylpyrimidine transporter CytX [Zophobihabitans entericus]QIQ21994.1 putative hydroxymethylpyrimidine transporter CytX [Zophobihabitans entericus]